MPDKNRSGSATRAPLGSRPVGGTAVPPGRQCRRSARGRHQIDVDALDAFGDKMVRAATRARLPYWREPDEIKQLAIMSALETHARYGLRLDRARTYYFRAAWGDITLALARRLVPLTIGEKAATRTAGTYGDVLVDLDSLATTESGYSEPLGALVAGDARADAKVTEDDRRRARDQLVLMMRGKAARLGRSHEEAVDRVLRGEPIGRGGGTTSRRLRETLGQDATARDLRGRMIAP